MSIKKTLKIILEKKKEDQNFQRKNNCQHKMLEFKIKIIESKSIKNSIKK